MAAPAPDKVTLTDLEIISRYSLAVGTNEVDRDELMTVLREDLAWLEDAAASAATPPARRRASAAPAAAGAAPRRRRTLGGAG